MVLQREHALSSAHSLPAVVDHHEAWGRIPQVLEDILAQDAHVAQIKTTLPKAKDAARMAEKIITLGKKGDLPAFRRATGFLLDQSLVPKLFTELAQRYADRPGGYTRIHKFGNRPGDNAPHAVLELVDNPRDLRFQMTARAVGWELLSKRIGQQNVQSLVASGIPEIHDVIEKEKNVAPEERGALRSVTRRNLQKVLKYRGSEAVEEMSRIAEDHAVSPVYIWFVSLLHTIHIGHPPCPTFGSQGHV
ncbi:hypothetical protein NUW54_g11391 [Trametes sanguinea]|uniref:Uncharacterized protein n=1 Tax=Trametes sanguinea TaxID=158606 RepID=A0ACC1NEB3_9APHY|nr:hypothetical protein NUW54_g11391 [Trametes sanguinea]